MAKQGPLAAILCIAYLAAAAIPIQYPYPLLYGEGPILDQAVRLANGESIYRPDWYEPPFTISNYTPIFVALQVPFVWLFGPAFWYGRLLSAAATVLAAFCIGVLVKRFTEDRSLPIFAGAIFITSPSVIWWGWMNRVDSVACLFWIASLIVLARRNVPVPALASGVLFAAAAVFTRQSYLFSALFAPTVWLLAAGQRVRAVQFFLCTLGAIGLAFLLLSWVTDGGAWTHIVAANVNAFSLDRAALVLEFCLSLFPFFVCLGLFCFLSPVVWKRDSGKLSLILIGSALPSLLSFGKIGSSFNYLYELSAALAFASCICVSVISASSERLRTLLKLVLLVGIGWQVFHPYPYRSTSSVLQVSLGDTTPLEEIVKYIEKAKGPVLLDELIGLELLGGKRLYYQPFIMNQLYKQGQFDNSVLLRQIREKKFPLIGIQHIEGHPHRDYRWSKEALESIEENYTPVSTIRTTTFYRPRP